MTTVEEIEDTKKCPLCGSNIDLNKLGRLGLSTEELEIIAQHTFERNATNSTDSLAGNRS